MVTKACQPGSIYLQTWIHFQTQMLLDTQMMNFLMLDSNYDVTLMVLRHRFCNILPLWKIYIVTHTQKHPVCEYNTCWPTLDRW